ncbi:MAG: hypothetical protein WC006_03880 [Bacilli bacterium]
MNSSYLIIAYIILVLLFGIFNKVNCFESFSIGVKDGTKTVVNMFTYIIGFVFMIKLIEASGILVFLEETIFKNTFSPVMLVQMLIRPFSGSSSYVVMLDIYSTLGPDSFEGLLSTFIHTISDSSIYMIVFYFAAIGIKKYKGVITFGLIINILGYLLSILAIYIFL